MSWENKNEIFITLKATNILFLISYTQELTYFLIVSLAILWTIASLLLVLNYWRVETIEPKGAPNLGTDLLEMDLKPLEKKQVVQYVNFLCNFLNVDNKVRTLLLLIGERVVFLWTKSGVKFTIQYLAEVMRLLLCFLSEEEIIEDKVKVKRYKNGLPKLLGERGAMIIAQLRNSQDWKSIRSASYLVKVLLSIISMFRAMSPEHVIKFDSVVKPFDGQYQTVGKDDLRVALGKLGIQKLELKSPKFLWSNKAGVNANRAWVSYSLDLIAMIESPLIWTNYIKYCWKLSYYSWMLRFIVISLLHIPFVIFRRVELSTYVFILISFWVFLIGNVVDLANLEDSILIFGGYIIFKKYFIFVLGNYSMFYEHGHVHDDGYVILNLGRLSIKKEMRGKARVVGITDNWTQCLFKPLHDTIYSFLSNNVAEDGTMDQLKPINEALYDRDSESFVSVDLSAATDRLPLAIQIDILNILGIPGTEWGQILKRPYDYRNSPKVYAVGQPMGAYSSFAMLALTNHVIMMLALVRSGVNQVPNQYAILGDDVAIKDQRLADSYIKIMRDLGVEINPIKGFRGRILEFAKRLFYIPNGNIPKGAVDLSPLGAKAALRASRDPIFLTTLIVDYFNKGFNILLRMELSVLSKILSSTFNKEGLTLNTFLFAILGPQSGLWSLLPEGDHAFVRVALKPFLTKVAGDLGFALKDYLLIFEKQVRIESSKFLFSLSGEWMKNFSSLSDFAQRPLVWSWEKFDYDEELPDPHLLAAQTSASMYFFIIPFFVLRTLDQLGENIILKESLLAQGNPKLGFTALHHDNIYWYDYILNWIDVRLVTIILVIVRFFEPLTKFEETTRLIAFNEGRMKRVNFLPRELDDFCYDQLGIFMDFVKSLKFQKILQLLTFKQDREGRKIDDILPVLKNNQRILAVLDPILKRKFILDRFMIHVQHAHNKVLKQGAKKAALTKLGLPIEQVKENLSPLSPLSMKYHNFVKNHPNWSTADKASMNALEMNLRMAGIDFEGFKKYGVFRSLHHKSQPKGKPSISNEKK